MSSVDTSNKTTNTLGTALRFRGPRLATRRREVLERRIVEWDQIPEHRAVKEELLKMMSGVSVVDVVKEAKADWSECRCAIHVPMECGVGGEPGCRGVGPGYHGAIKALYEASHYVCALEHGVRMLDKKFFLYVEFGQDYVDDPVKRFAKGRSMSPFALGAYYCYTWLFPETIVCRVARILGPFPKVVRVLRYYLAVGHSSIAGLQVETLSSGDLHLAIQGNDEVMAVDIVRMLIAAGPDARVGVSEDEVRPFGGRENVGADGKTVRGGGPHGPFEDVDEDVVECADGSSVQAVIGERVAKDLERVWWPRGMTNARPVQCGMKFSSCGGMQDAYGDVFEVVPDPVRVRDSVINDASRVYEWLATKTGVFLPGIAMQDLALVVYTAGTVPDAMNNGKHRLRMLALLGDRVIKVILVLQGIARGHQVADVQAVEARIQSNVAMARYAEREGFVSMIHFAPGVPSDSTKVVGTCVEALLGVVAKFCGFTKVKRVAELFGAVPVVDAAMIFL